MSLKNPSYLIKCVPLYEYWLTYTFTHSHPLPVPQRFCWMFHITLAHAG